MYVDLNVKKWCIEFLQSIHKMHQLNKYVTNTFVSFKMLRKHF